VCAGAGCAACEDGHWCWVQGSRTRCGAAISAAAYRRVCVIAGPRPRGSGGVPSLASLVRREVPALNLGNVEPANLTETTAF